MSNPIRQILPDDLFRVLLDLNLINRKVLRDFEIKREYKLMRRRGLKSQEAIDALLEAYPYLQFDTVRKIIYSIRLPEEAAYMVDWATVTTGRVRQVKLQLFQDQSIMHFQGQAFGMISTGVTYSAHPYAAMKVISGGGYHSRNRRLNSE
mgnify:CR=1 FL=1